MFLAWGWQASHWEVALGEGGLCPALAHLLSSPTTATDGDTRFRTLKLLCDTLSAFLHDPMLYGAVMTHGHVAPPPVSDSLPATAGAA